LLSILLLLLITGCADILVENPKDFAGPDNFYKTPNQIEASLTASMAVLYPEWGVYSWGALSEFENDDQLYGGNFVNTQDRGKSLWDAHYKSISNLNPAIKALKNNNLGTSANQEVKDYLMAQAKFIRAYNYFVLVRLWGDIPLITEENNAAVDEIERTPIKTVYDSIQSDLLFSIKYLPSSWADQPGKPTIGAAKSLLAKVYITRATAPLNEVTYYQKARDMAASVISDGIYSLVPDVNKVFAMEYKYGPEMIWSFNATTDKPSSSPQMYLPPTMNDGWSDFVADKAWADTLYPEQPRKFAYLIFKDDNGEPYTKWWKPAPHIRKFLNDADNWEKYTSVQGIPILRFADVLLLFAEAENMVNGGPTQAAVDAVNKIIDRANGYVINPADPLLTTAMSRDDFDAAVIQQRNWELCFEFDRWYDLIRKKLLLKTAIPTIQQNIDETDYLWPIPESDIVLNPLLTQNPGY
jgi:hypothetical protein